MVLSGLKAWNDERCSQPTNNIRQILVIIDSIRVGGQKKPRRAWPSIEMPECNILDSPHLLNLNSLEQKNRSTNNYEFHLSDHVRLNETSAAVIVKLNQPFSLMA